MSKVGFIGLGAMGRPMARNLLRAGHDVTFFTRRDEIAKEFTAAGAARASSPADAARGADFIIAIVTADAEATEVALGPQGIVHGADRGAVFIDMSTVSPQTDQHIGAELATRGVDTLDAPVSGGPWGAESGTLTIMVGGEAQTLERARRLLMAMGKNIFHLGPLGAGQTVKLANQMVAGGIMALVGEAYALGDAAGVDPAQLTEVMLASSAASAVLEARGKKFVLANNYQPGFTTQLMHKDMRLATDLAAERQVPTPVATQARAVYQATESSGLGNEDFAAVVKTCRAAAKQI